jgi:hypothetical protein
MAQRIAKIIGSGVGAQVLQNHENKPPKYFEVPRRDSSLLMTFDAF